MSVAMPDVKPIALADSFLACQRLARHTGKNFYLTFLVLPRDLFRDMCALYAFMRVTDDLGDDEELPPGERQRRLADWRRCLDSAVADGAVVVPPDDVDGYVHSYAAHVLPAMTDVIRRRSIPVRYLHDVIDGVESDLSPRTIRTFGDLQGYCYQVAGAVGLCCIHVWGFDDEAAIPRAIDCGTAFQLTNILRDLNEDVLNGRVYLPEEDLSRFGYGPEEMRQGVRNDAFRELMRFEVERAKGFYQSGSELFRYLKRPGRCILTAMFSTYGGLLREIERRDFDVYSRRVAFSKLRKVMFGLRSLMFPAGASGPQ